MSKERPLPCLFGCTAEEGKNRLMADCPVHGCTRTISIKHPDTGQATSPLVGESALFKPLHEGVVIPSRSRLADMGFDLVWCGCPPDTKEFLGMTQVKFPTGLSMSLPWWLGWEIRDRSGFSWEYGAHVIGGIIDSGYRGQLFVAIQFHHALEDPGLFPFGGVRGVENPQPFRFKIKPGHRIAQLLLRHNPPVDPLLANDLPPSDRGDSGYGSSGV